MAYINIYTIIFGFLATVSLTIYGLFQYSYTYWKRRGVIGPKPSFPEGNFQGVFTKKCHISAPIARLYEQYKSEPYIGVYTLYKPVLIINDLELIKDVLIKDFDHFDSHGVLENEDIDPLSINLFSLSGDRWREMRTKLSPVFTSGKLRSMIGVMVEVQKRLTSHVGQRMKIDPVVDFKELFSFYTMDIVGSCAFGIQCDSFGDPNSQFVKYARESVTATKLRTQLTSTLSFMAPAVLEWLRVSAQSPGVISFFTRLVRETVQHRERSRLQRNDLMQLLIQIKNNELKNDHGELVQQGGRQFTTADLVAQTFVFLVAGYETSSSAASYALHWLARRPDLQRRVRSEIRAVLARHDGKWTYDALQELEYLTMVIEETLRLHPALNFLVRRCTRRYRLAGALTLEPGGQVYVPVLALHTDPRLYPEPDVFRPERFSREEKARRPRAAYLPFGDGPRICIGMRFAMTQVRLALASVLAEYEVSICARSSVPLQLDKSALVTAPHGGVYLHVQLAS